MVRVVRRILVGLAFPPRVAPELDRLSGREVRAFVARAREAGELRGVLLAARVGAVLVAGPTMFTAAIGLLQVASPRIAVAAGAGAALLAARAAYVFVLGNGLSAAVAARLYITSCPRCGRPVAAREEPGTHGIMACARCGRASVRVDAFNSVAQLIACDVRDDRRWRRWAAALPEACECGYSLKGAPVPDGIATCPECGLRHALASVGGGPPLAADASPEPATRPSASPSSAPSPS